MNKMKTTFKNELIESKSICSLFFSVFSFGTIQLCIYEIFNCSTVE